MNIAIDLGGTSVRVSLVDGSKIVSLISEPCRADRPENEVLDHICSLIDRLFSTEVKAIGVGVPSVVDAEKGIVYDVVGIPSWKEVHLKEVLEEKYHVPAYINNDCNCFALGVSTYGEARGYSSAVCVTLGTGVGSSLVVNGSIYNGHNTGAGEIGCIQYLDKDYEYYCSSRFFTGKGTTGKDAAEKALANDSGAMSLWDEFGHNMGQLAMMIVYAYDPEIIVFGGSISTAWRLFEKSMRAELGKCIYPKSIERLKICPAGRLEMNILGASSLCDAPSF